jgi:hypothetical protein
MKHILRALALIIGLLPPLAVAQQFPTVPDRSVIGRIGVGGQSGPSQAIPFATLVTQIGAIKSPGATTVGHLALWNSAAGLALSDFSGTSGGVPYFKSDGGIGTSAVLPQFGVMIGGGAGATPGAIPACTNNQALMGATGLVPTCRSLLAADLPLGVSNNTRSAYTSVNSMATTDCGKTVALGGSAFYTFTVGAASGFNAACQTVIVNEDAVCPSLGAATCRGKALAINGYTAFILWPGQKFTLVNQNNVWQFDQPGRWVVQASIQMNVNHASGANPFAATPATDCLGSGAGACNTIMNCVLLIEGMVDNNGFGPTCKNVNETFTENNVSHTHTIIGFHVISITGDTTTPGNVVWQVSGSGNAGMNCRDGGYAIVTGFKFVSTGSGNLFIQGGQLGVCDFGSIDFGANSGGYDLNQTPGGAANFFGGTLAISGDMAGFVLSNGEGHVLLDGATISIPNARTWTNFFQITGPGIVSATSMTFTGTGAGAGSTGRQWLIDRFQNLNVSGSTIPGASVGLYNCQPITSVFTSGTNTTFTPSTCNGLFPLVLEVELQGGGGGGAGSGTTPGAAGAGGATCWNSSGTACTTPIYQAGGGAAGTVTVGNTVAGGTVTGSGACTDATAGSSVGSGSNQANTPGAPGGTSRLGGAGAQGFATAGAAAAANTGSGGGGGGVGGVANGGGGGAPGAYCFVMITNPAPSSAVYTIGAAGTAGTAGTSGFAGGAGAAGRVKVIQRW